MNILWLFSLATITSAHFTLHGSREQAAINHNERFWPIRGGNTLRQIKDCLQFPPTSPRQLTPGSTVRLPFEIGGGASHVGMCTAELINPVTGHTVQIGTENNCVSRNQAMTITLPNCVHCSRCVVKVKVHATHIPTAPENYDSCVDVTFSSAPPCRCGRQSV